MPMKKLIMLLLPVFRKVWLNNQTAYGMLTNRKVFSRNGNLAVAIGNVSWAVQN